MSGVRCQVKLPIGILRWEIPTAAKTARSSLVMAVMVIKVVVTAMVMELEMAQVMVITW